MNAANSALIHGGGVAGTIVRKGGREIRDESCRVAPVAVGQAAITGAGKLPAHFVIHAVGPRWGEGDEDGKLASAVQSSLALAEKHGLSSISLPAISSGIFGFPKDRCARVIVEAVLKYLPQNPAGSLREVRICLIDPAYAEIFAQELARQTAGSG